MATRCSRLEATVVFMVNAGRDPGGQMLGRVHQLCVVAVPVLGLAGCGGREADAAAAVVASIVGDWRAPRETTVMSILADGAYSWGKIEGRFSGLDAQRVSMNVLENGRFAGGMPQKVARSGDTLRLTGPDGSTMLFLRVTP